jgi:hypothetical protein
VIRRVVPLAGWLAAVGVAVLALHRLGADPAWSLPGRSGVVVWLEQRTPEVAAFALLRLVALGAGWYLLAVTSVALVLRLVRADGAAAAVERCAPPAVSRVVRTALGISLAASSLTITSAAAESPPMPPDTSTTTSLPPPTMRRLPEPSPTTAPIPTVPGAPDRSPTTSVPSPTMRRLPEAATTTSAPAPTNGAMPDPAPTTSGPHDATPTSEVPRRSGDGASGSPPTSMPPSMRRLSDSLATTATAPHPSEDGAPEAPASPPPDVSPDARADRGLAARVRRPLGTRADAPAESGPTDPPAAAVGAATTWVVEPGDHLWAIAERTLAEAWQRPPNDHEIDPFWRAIVERNRPHLRDPQNPDLLFPGDRIEVLAPPPR